MRAQVCREGEGSEILIILVLGLHSRVELLIKEEELRSLLGSTRSFDLKATHRAFVLFAKLVAKNYSHEFFRFELETKMDDFNLPLNPSQRTLFFILYYCSILEWALEIKGEFI